MEKILIISPFNAFPPTNGGERRISVIAKKHALNKKVIFIGPTRRKKIFNKNIEYIESFKDKKYYRGLSFRLIKSIMTNSKNKNEIIFLEFPWQSINLILLGKKYILDEHNVEFLRFKRIGSVIWPLIYIYELLACRSAKKIICVSEVDKSYLTRYFLLNSNKIEVVENPVDQKLFHPKNTKEHIRNKINIKNNEKLILFFGQLNYKPNAEALKNIADEVIPRLELSRKSYKIVICGKGDGLGLLRTFKHKNLIVTGFVDKIQDYINASDVVIVPLNSGGGTRLKILEALACKKRVISTTIGAEGLKPNKLLEVEDDWAKFVEKI